MNGVDITSATLMIQPGTGLLVGTGFGLACYYIGRLSQRLDDKYQARCERKRGERRRRKLTESAA